MSGLAEILEENERLRRDLSRRDAMIAEHESTLAEREATLAEREAMLARVAAERDTAVDRLGQLERALKLIELKRSGPASQRFVPDEQHMLPMFGDVVAPPRAPQPRLRRSLPSRSHQTLPVRRRAVAPATTSPRCLRAPSAAVRRLTPPAPAAVAR